MPVDENGRWTPVRGGAITPSTNKPPKWFNPYDAENEVSIEREPESVQVAPIEPPAPATSENWYQKLDRDKFSGSLPFGAPSPYHGQADFKDWGEVADTAIQVLPQLKGIGMVAEGVKSLPYVGKVLGAPSKVKDIFRELPLPAKITAGAASAIPVVETYRGMTNPDVSENNFFTQTGSSLRAGTGDVVETVGNATKWQGADGLGDSLIQSGQNIKEGFEIQPQEFTWKSLLDPNFYSTNVARSVPSMAALAPAMITGYKGAGKVLGKTDLNPFAKSVISSLTGSLTSRPIESAMEAGSTYQDALARGMSEQEADQAANHTFKSNLALFGLDAVELAAAFAPTPFKPANRIGKAGLVTGRIGLTSAVEGAEEGVQDVIQRQAVGDKVAWDPRMKESMAIGALLGGGMGAFGAVHEAITQRVVEQLPPAGQQAFDNTIQQKINTGMTEEQAIDSTFDDLVGTDIGRGIVEQAVQGVMADIQSGKFKPQTPGGEQEPVVVQTPQVPVPVNPIPPTQTTIPTTPRPNRSGVEVFEDVAPVEVQDNTLVNQTNNQPAPTNQTATDITSSFESLANGFQEAGYKKTMDTVAKQGYVSFKKKEAADLFRSNPKYKGWQEEQVNGEYRFSPPIVNQEQQPVNPPVKQQEPVIDIKTPTITPVKYGRSGNATYKKWGTNEIVNADLNDHNDEYTQAYRRFFEHFYNKGLKGEPNKTFGDPEYLKMLESDHHFPPHLEDTFYKAGVEDAKRSSGQQNKVPVKQEISELTQVLEQQPLQQQQSTQQIEVSNFVDEALKEKQGQKYLTLRKVTPEEADVIKQLISVDVTGFRHEINSNDLRHAIKHGNSIKEAKLNQLPITDKDLKAIPDVINSPDEILPGSKTRNRIGKDLIYKKQVNGFIYYVEVINSKKGILSGKTMWKKPSKADRGSDSPTPPYTSETEPGLTSSNDNNISPGQTNVNSNVNTNINHKEPVRQQDTEIPIQDTVKQLENTSQESENQVESSKAPHSQIANFVLEKMEQRKKFGSLQLFLNADKAFGGNQSSGKYTPKDAYDAMELGVNQYLLKHKKSVGPMVDINTAKRNIETIQNIIDKLPTQTKRTAEQEEFQQFSTPPTLAYTAAWVANITNKDTVLEPSAGIGGLAVFAKTAGAHVIVNELSPRRAEVLKEMGFDRHFSENAEQLNNILPADIKPTVVIMNPPFSSTSGRTKGKTNNKNVIPHIEQALKRLQPGGRLVAIVGRGMSEDAATFKQWWSDTKKVYNVRANIGIDGKNYTKYGTSFDVQILVIDKTGPTTDKTVVGRVDKLEDILPLLEGIKRDRPEINGQVEQSTDKPSSEKVSGTGESEARPVNAVPVSVDRVGTDQRGTVSAGPERQGKRGGTSDTRSTGDSKTADVQQQHGDVNGLTNETRTDGLPGRGTLGGTEGTKGTRRHGRSGMVSDRSTTGSLRGDESGVPEEAEFRRENPGRRDVTTRGTKTRKNLGDSVFSDYTPQKLKIAGAKPHPGKLSQSSAMAAVDPPVPTYKPNLPEEVIKEGKLSIAQLEAVVYAGQAHEQDLPNGNRRGFFIGDGTGVGKGREISGIILDNMMQGRKKAVWISMNKPLFDDAKRDYGDIGGNEKLLFDFGKVKKGTKAKQNEGVAFTTYSTLAKGLSSSREGYVDVKEGESARIDQLIDWLGKDFDGVIAFDEAHNMQNSVAMKGKRGKKKAAIRALAGIELQRRLPKARIVYVSATGATEVSNLAYADRLGLWGEGTPFADKLDFINKVQAGGLAAMELVARDMKALGVYLARSLSYDDVTYGTLEHKLTTEQTEIYDTMARGWQIVLQNIHKALEATGQNGDSQSRSNAMSAFWGSQQRFFNQVLTSMQMPVVIKQVKEDIANGKAVVMQLVNTNEAAQDRQLSKMEEGDSLEDLDLTPREALMQYLENSFPTTQYEEYTDLDGNTQYRPVLDSQGKPVENAEAVAMKEELMNRLGSMRVPEGPLEIILNSFGANNVSEITGRKRRVIQVQNEYDNMEKKEETRSDANIAAEAKAFQDDKRQILVFSNAGGTGRSYHASLKEKNQRPRVHYLIQAGWTASNAVQGFGRTHRTNQAGAPHYVLVTTNLKGQKRFISSIARRLDQLGALTKGQRQTGSQGLFSAKDNLESPLASDALQRFYQDLTDGQIKEIENPQALLTKMGLQGIIDKHGNLNQKSDTLREIPKFLNRILALDSTEQNQVFDAFYSRLEAFVNYAIANGTLDTGLENLKADKVIVTEEKNVYTDEKSGAETKYVALNVGTKIKPRPFERVNNLHDLLGIYKNTRSGRVYGIVNTGSTTTLTSGGVVDNYRIYGQAEDNITTTTKPEFEKGNWEKLSEADAQNAWNDELKKLPEYRFRNEHLITGALLPIWDRLPDGQVRVIRVLTDDGNILLGRLIPEKAIDNTLKKLGASRTKEELSPADTVNKILQGHTVYLANGWKIVRKRVANEFRIEIIGKDMYRHIQNLNSEGVFIERINYETRLFIPTGEKAAEVFEKVTKYRPVTDVVAPSGNSVSVDNSGEVKSFDELQQELSAAVDEKIGEVKPKVGMSVQDVSRNPFRRDNQQQNNPAHSRKEFKLNNEEAEARFQEAQGQPKETGKIKEGLTTIWHQITRAFEHLPPGAEYEPIRFQLLELKKQIGVANDKTLRILQGLTSKMDKQAYKVFRYKVIFDDLINEAEVQEVGPEQTLWFGLTLDEMKSEMDRINKELEFYPEVNKAVKFRHELWSGFKNEYIKAMKDIGFNVEKKLQKQDYYRHLVIKYAEEKHKANPGRKKITMPTKAGYLKQRGNTNLDINTEFIEAEYEVMSRMLYDIERAKLFKLLDDKYNIVKELKRQAIELNDANIMPLFREMAKEWNENAARKRTDYTGEDVYRQTLNEKQAMAVGKLADMALNGALPDNNGEYSGLFNALIESYYDEDGIKRDNSEPMPDKYSKQLYRYAAWLLKTSEKADIEGRTITDLSEVPKDIIGYQVRLPGDNGFGKVVNYNKRNGMTKVQTKGKEIKEFRITELKLIGKGNNAGTPAMAAAMLFKGRAEKQQFLRENLGAKYATWENIIPEGYSRLKQKEGTIFYFADSIESKQAEMLYSGLVEELGVKQEDLQRVMVMGGQIKDYVIPDAIIATIDNLDPYRADKISIGKGLRAIQRNWKVYQLISPRRFFKYNIRNISGDADALFVGNPSAFKKVPQAVKELYPVFAADRSMTPNMKDWFERGGFETLLQAQEIGQINQLKMFVDIVERENKKGVFSKIGTPFIKVFQGYWKTARLSTDFREAILRYAAYLDFLEQMQSNKESRPKTFAASYPGEVMALDDIKDRAFKLSNELLGAYDQVSIQGQWLREHLIPFWSWQEVNFKRYVKLIKNAARDDKIAGLVGRKLLVGTAVRSPVIAIKVGKMALMASAMWLILSLWNDTFFPDEEKELSEDERRKPHIILGRNKDGTISNFTRLGAMQDFVDWFGVDAGSIQDIKDILNGKMTIKEYAQNTAKNFVNKFAQGITPFIKAPLEAVSGKKYFPNIFKPATNRDGWLNFFHGLSLDNEYRMIAGLPSRPYNETFENLFYYNTDPKQVAYYATLDLKDKFNKDVLKKGDGSGSSIRTDILYNYKLAVRYGDKEAMKKYLTEYALNKGTLKGMIQSYKMSYPLYGMKKEDQIKFIQSLDKDEVLDLKKALVYYQENYGEKLRQLEAMKR